jgi:hypothetical protein
MKTHPMLFNGAMVRAILGGHKTQTRRFVNHLTVRGLSKARMAWYDLDKAWLDKGPGDGPYLKCDSTHPDDDGAMARLRPIWSVGDVLWVRENVRIAPLNFGDADSCNATDFDGQRRLVGHEATMDSEAKRCAEDFGVKTTPSIHMPRWAARIFLRVTDVRAQRIQDISEEDAMAEGVREKTIAQIAGTGDPLGVFRSLWHETYGPESWDANPWVWALTFERTTDPGRIG